LEATLLFLFIADGVSRGLRAAEFLRLPQEVKVIQQEFTVEDYVVMLRRRWPIIVGLALLGGGLGYGVTRFLPKRFTSQTLVLVAQPTVPGDYVKPVVSEDTNQRLASMQQEILSRTRLEPLIQQFGLFGAEVNQASMEDLVERLRRTVTVTPIQPMAETRSQGLPGFTISVTFEDPHLAQQICSTVTSMFMEENLRLRQQQAEQTTQFIAKQLDDAKTKLDGEDAKLAAFKRKYLGSLPDQEQANLNLLTGFTSQLDAVTQELNRAQQDKSFAESILAQQISAWQATQNGQNPETFDRELTALQAQLTELKSKYTDDHPDVIRIRNDIDTLKKKMVDAEEQKKNLPEPVTKEPVEPTQIQALRAQIHQYGQLIQQKSKQQEELQQQIKLYQERVQASPSIEQEYKELTRGYQTALDFYNDLLKKRDQSAMASDLERRQEGEQFQVLDPANLPAAPSFPKRSVFTLGGLGGGLGLGLILAFLLELQDTSLRNGKQAEALLQLPVLASIPEVAKLGSKKTSGFLVGT
jgi:polysaccharide chain length determinant protein (PEP-CTERM system associated)